MDIKGYSTVETALTFPLFLLLTVVLIFMLIMFVRPKPIASYDGEAFINRVYMTDSIKRKAELIDGILE